MTPVTSAILPAVHRRRENGPDSFAVDAEGLGEVGDRDDDAAAEADALEVAATDELVGLFDGEREGAAFVDLLDQAASSRSASRWLPRTFRST